MKDCMKYNSSHVTKELWCPSAWSWTQDCATDILLWHGDSEKDSSYCYLCKWPSEWHQWLNFSYWFPGANYYPAFNMVSSSMEKIVFISNEMYGEENFNRDGRPLTNNGNNCFNCFFYSIPLAFPLPLWSKVSHDLYPFVILPQFLIAKILLS